MGSKVLAAQMASTAGIPTVIAGGQGDDVGPVLAGEARGTRFAADDRIETAFKLWLRFGKPVAGRLHVDGAHARRGRSDLLPAIGVRSLRGTVSTGYAVELVGGRGRLRQGNRGRRDGMSPAGRAIWRQCTATGLCSTSHVARFALTLALVVLTGSAASGAGSAPSACTPTRADSLGPYYEPGAPVR